MSKARLVETADIAAMKARTVDVPRIAAAVDAGNILAGATPPPDAPTALTAEEFRQAKADFRIAKKAFHDLNVQCRDAKKEMDRLGELIRITNEKMIDQLTGGPRSNAAANAGNPPAPAGGRP